MPFRWDPKEHLSLAAYTVRWSVLTVPVAVAIGSVVAFFLWALDLATSTRLAHPWLVWFLPLAGVPLLWVYLNFGGKSDQGNNLVIDEIHEPGGGVPLRMTPLILGSTVATHLFGGSAGREGTAVQMGGSLASSAARWLNLPHGTAKVLMMAGVAAGFAAVFGTPLAGTVFAMEVLSIGSMQYEAILPCLGAAVVADRTCAAWGTHHTDYHLGIFSPGQGLASFDWLVCGQVLVAGAAFGLAALLFAELNHGLGTLMKRRLKAFWLRPLVGGAVIILLVYVLGTSDYLGLGVRSTSPQGVSILSSFQMGGATPWSWLWKTLFTAITLSAGFKGGEVTPLFFIGAALGNALAVMMGAPVDLFAGLGFVAVFAGATNTPLACTLMGVELFGGRQVLYLAIACFVAYFFGSSGFCVAGIIGPPTPWPGRGPSRHSGSRWQRGSALGFESRKLAA